MKCPKCGFNSFEGLTACKKCSQDLTAYQIKHGLKPIVLPTETRNAMVAAMAVDAAQVADAQQPEEQPNDMFSFDIPDEETDAPATKTAKAEDFFDFSDKAAPAPPAGFGTFTFDDDQAVKKPATMDDAFASLLESTPRGNAAGSATPPASPPAQPAASQGSSADEFDLDSFSWDEPPETTATGEKKPVDDFDSLFGEISADVKK